MPHSCLCPLPHGLTAPGAAVGASTAIAPTYSMDWQIADPGIYPLMHDQFSGLARARLMQCSSVKYNRNTTFDVPRQHGSERKFRPG
jgi:hypothetical protein